MISSWFCNLGTLFGLVLKPVFGPHLTGSGVPMVAVLATGETAGGVDTRVPIEDIHFTSK
jgi:hypothetical protein